MCDYKSIFASALTRVDVRDYRSLPKVSLDDIPNVDSLGYVVPRDSLKDKQRLFDEGLQLISNDEVSIVILSGGQASRFDGHIKAIMQISLFKHKTLLQLHLEKIKNMFKRAGLLRGNPADVYTITEHPRIFVLTSIYNHDSIHEYLLVNNHFNLNKERLVLLKQDNFPCFLADTHEFIRTPTNRLSIENGDNIVYSPNGNGNLYECLSKCPEFLNSLNKLKLLHIISVDNAFSKPLDPLFLGLAHRFNHIDSFNKCILKRDDENLGIFCQSDHPCVVEYSELDRANFVNNENPFYGNICDHLFTIEFIKRVFNQKLYTKLPYHSIMKKIPYWDFDLKLLIFPNNLNGYKMELFIFDILKFANKTLCIEVDRDDSFAPVKTLMDCDLNNPTAVQYRMSSLYKRWLSEVDCIVEGECELSPSLSYEGEGLERFTGRRYKSVYLSEQGVVEMDDVVKC